MSEPCQLFARVRLSRPQLDRFLNSAFPDPVGDADVLAWLSNASCYGERYTVDSIRERFRDVSTVGAWIDELMHPTCRYDDTTQTWTLAVLDFSESYEDVTAAIAAFRAIARFKDLPGDGDGMLIYGYMYEHGYVVTALGIERGVCRFLDDGAPKGLTMQADAAMESLLSHSRTSL